MQSVKNIQELENTIAYTHDKTINPYAPSG